MVSNTVQLKSKLTLVCGKHECVLQFLLCLDSKHACDMKWGASESTFIHVIHNSKKYTSNPLCAACKAVFLCPSCKLTAVFCQRNIEAYNKNHPSKT